MELSSPFVEWNGTERGAEMEETEIVGPLFLVCRLCINGDGKYAIVPSTPIHIAITEIFGVKIEPYDGLSQLLCVECREKLLEIQNLRNTYIMNQKILESLKSTHKNNAQIKTEENPNEEAAAEREVTIAKKTEDQNHKTKINEVEVIPENPDTAEIKSEINEVRSQSESNINDDLISENKKNDMNKDVIHENSQKDINNRVIEKITSRSKSVQEENVNTVDIGLPDNLKSKNSINEYKYYCRFCSANFETVTFLKTHLKSHIHLINIQCRYTPYGCSVKLLRFLHKNCNEATDTGRYHPHFYVKRKEKEMNVSHGTVEINSDHVTSDLDIADFEDGFVSGDDCDMPDDINTIFHPRSDCVLEKSSSSIRDYFKEANSSMPPAADSHETDFLNFGSILRETCSILDQDQEEPKPVIEYLPNEEDISEIIWSRISKHQTNMADTELIQVQQILLQMCKRNIRLEWKNTKDSCPVINLHLPKPTSFKSTYHKNLYGYSLVPIKQEVSVDNKKNSSPALTVPSGTQNSNSSKLKEPLGKTCETPNPKRDLDVGAGIIAVRAATETMPEAQVERPQLPVIINTTSLQASALGADDSTSVYIDLEDEAHTLSSDQSPIMFLTLLLKNHEIDLSLKTPNPEATNLCCFKKLINNDNLIISLYVEGSIFYLEVSTGLTNMDLEKASFITQWHIISSLTEPNPEKLIRNYAKRSPICCEIVDKFLKIGRTISGTIQGDFVSMRAPSKFFF